MLRLVSSLARSVGSAIRNDPEVRRLTAAHPQVVAFALARFDRSNPFGLRLTVGMTVAAICLIAFMGVLQDVLANDPLALADLRVISAVQLFRSAQADAVMLFFTYLANWQIVILGAALTAVALAVARRWIWLFTLILSVAGGEGLVWALKNVLNRPRPDLTNALIGAQGASFPSGHAFVAISLYGAVAWFGLHTVRPIAAKLLLVMSTALLIVMIGFSRVYLGVHSPTDVLASFALGTGWLAALVTAARIAEAQPAFSVIPPPVGLKAAVGAIAAAIWVLGSMFFYVTHPLPARAQPLAATSPLPRQGFPADLFALVPRYSETITGAPMEPINVVLVGRPEDVARAFAQAGWYATDSITVPSVWRLIVAALSNRPYPEAPGLPAFWSGTPNRSGFERPTASNSARERHHLHLWETQFRVDGDEVWVGTVHLDSGATAPSGVRLPIHQIDPNIDRERNALQADLTRAECVTGVSADQVVDPMLGQNAAGTPFFTDGKAIVVFVRC